MRKSLSSFGHGRWRGVAATPGKSRKRPARMHFDGSASRAGLVSSSGAFVRLPPMKIPLLITICLAAVLTGCATADFTPYVGEQQKWPIAKGAFVTTVN